MVKKYDIIACTSWKIPKKCPCEYKDTCEVLDKRKNNGDIDTMYMLYEVPKIELDYSDNIEPFYPEFTKEKQLELWKYLLRQQDLNIQYYYVDKKYGFVIADEEEFFFEHKRFEVALAKLVIYLKKRLNKKEVRKILKDDKF